MRQQPGILCCPPYPCRYARFQWRRFGFACCNAVKPRPRLPALRWSPGQSFHRVKGSDFPFLLKSVYPMQSLFYCNIKILRQVLFVLKLQSYSNKRYKNERDSIMLVFCSLVSLVQNSVVLAVYLLFSVACFFTVHEH